MNWNRRAWLQAGAISAATLLANRAKSDLLALARESTRGVVLILEDLSLADWPKRVQSAGLTTIGIHHQNSPNAVVRWIKADVGQRFLEQCRDLRLEVEYELHAMKDLLPRELFSKQPHLFRMNERGERIADSNCCVHSRDALDLIAENAVTIAKTLKPTTGRYYYWGDDGQPWCQCPKCRELAPADQALTIENRILKSLRQSDPQAQIAHLAYANTIVPPTHIKPSEGVFLEYAPIHRRYDIPYKQQQDPKFQDGLSALDANLKVFPAQTAQVLEYWLDVSRFSGWKRPAVRLPWNPDVLKADIQTYRERGIRHITSFAVWIDQDYRDRFQDLDFIAGYGRALR